MKCNTHMPEIIFKLMNTQNLGHPQDTHLGLSLRPPLLPPPRATGLGPSSMGSRGTEGAAALAFFGIRTIYYSSSKSLCHHENSYAHQKTRVGVTIRVLSQSQRKCTMKRRRSKRWGPNPTKNPTHTISAHAPPTACNRYGSLLRTAERRVHTHNVADHAAPATCTRPEHTQ